MKASIAACGGTDFVTEDAPIQDVLAEAARDLFERNPTVSRDQVDAVLVSTNDGGRYLSAILAEMCGIRPRISHTVENLCSSGASSIISGISYVMSGLARSVLVVGGDRLAGPGRVLDWDTARGEFVRPIFWGSILTSSYRRRFGIAPEVLAAVPAKNYRNAQDNPHACRGRAYTVLEVLESRRVTDDLRLLECSRTCTGASAVLITDGTLPGSQDAVGVAGIGQQTDSASFVKSGSFCEMPTVAASARAAYASAGIGPSDVDVAEVHDAFAVCEPMALEALGIAEAGRGAHLSEEMYGTGDRMINPRGGIIGSGHPLGATGVAQTAEIFCQLQAGAGRRQVPGARIGLVQNMSAAATSSSVIILEA